MEILLEPTSNKLMVVTHWFTRIVLSALRHSDNENMLSAMNLIRRSSQIRRILKDGHGGLLNHLVKPQQSSVPFPNWVRKEKEKALQRIFLKNLKQLDINIQFIEALVQIPKYTKYLKSLLMNKSRLEEACMETTNQKVLNCLAQRTAIKRKRPKSFTTPCQVLEKHKEAEDVAANHLSWFENPHMEVLTDKEIADKFFDKHLMALKSMSNNDEPWYADFVNYIVGKEEPYAFKLCADNIMRRCVAGSETLEILAHCHSGPTGGHHSANITAKKVYESVFHWPSVFKDANEYVRRCDACQRSGNITSRYEMPQNNIQVEAQALPMNDARVVVKFLRSLFARFRVPKALISDRGTHFCNSQLEKALQRYGVTHKLSMAYHPQSNGQTEVTNRAIKRILERPVSTILKIEHKAHWALKQCNMDLMLASESRLMQLNELAELRDGAYENTRIYKERTKKWHDSRLRGDKDFKSGPNIVKTVYPHGAIEITDKDEFNFKVNGQRLKKYYGGDIDKEDDEVSIRHILGNGYGVSTSCKVLGPRERNIDEYWWRIYKFEDLEVLES
ncbi:reverse transcriptase domain-containing protein [Tanacetum coccineum]|uniref:Reverse transcriptase domain-containing protein n=1 Tax=Tanacetum coccineum TaxID=301880 RepID=A0ABQ5FU03_9ASTR